MGSHGLLGCLFSLNDAQSTRTPAMYIAPKILTAPFLALSMVGAPSTLAQPSPQRSETLPVLHAVRAMASIRVDGVLDEPDWGRAIVASDFTQSYPAPGAAPG